MTEIIITIAAVALLAITILIGAIRVQDSSKVSTLVGWSVAILTTTGAVCGVLATTVFA